MTASLHAKYAYKRHSSAPRRPTRLYASRKKRGAGSRSGDKYRSMTRPEQPALIAFDLDGTLWYAAFCCSIIQYRWLCGCCSVLR